MQNEPQQFQLHLVLPQKVFCRINYEVFHVCTTCYCKSNTTPSQGVSAFLAVKWGSRALPGTVTGVFSTSDLLQCPQISCKIHIYAFSLSYYIPLKSSSYTGTSEREARSPVWVPCVNQNKTANKVKYMI